MTRIHDGIARGWRQIVATLLLAAAALAVHAEAGPTGLWRVIGDKSGEAEALIAIKERDGQLEGTIVRIFPRPGVDPEARCEQCPGARRNQPVQGLTILTGLRRDGDEYKGGEILDPESGDVYRCKATLSADGRRLHLRGYIGISLFGRTQTWMREE